MSVSWKIEKWYARVVHTCVHACLITFWVSLEWGLLLQGTKRNGQTRFQKTNPHKAILWFQQHVILYSQSNVIIQRWPL
jgi:hypothetical protein